MKGEFRMGRWYPLYHDRHTHHAHPCIQTCLDIKKKRGIQSYHYYYFCNNITIITFVCFALTTCIANKWWLALPVAQ